MSISPCRCPAHGYIKHQRTPTPRSKEKLMRKRLACGIVLGLALAALTGLGRRDRTEAAEEGTTMLAHNVFFSLKDNSAEAKKKLVDACKKYLTKHDGE